MNNVNNAINKQQIGKTMPKYLFVISCSFISFQKLLSSNLLYNQVLHVHTSNSYTWHDIDVNTWALCSGITV